MRPFSQKLPFAKRDILIQGTACARSGAWKSPLRKIASPFASTRRSAQCRPPTADTEDQLRLRLSEELEYARRMLDITGDQICADRIVVTRHAAALHRWTGSAICWAISPQSSAPATLIRPSARSG